MFKEEYFTEIDAYLSNNMATEERQIFEEKLKSDAALAAELDTYQQVLTGIEPLEKQQLRHKIATVTSDLTAERFFKTENDPLSIKDKIVAVTSDLTAEGFFKTENDPLSIKSKIDAVHVGMQGESFFVEEKTKVRTMTPLRWIMAAAASVLLLVIGYNIGKPKVDFDAVATQYIKPEEKEAVALILNLKNPDAMGSGTKSADLLHALELYQARNYADAITAFRNYKTQYGQSADGTTDFYLAVSLLANKGNLDEATALLKPLANEPKSDWAAEATWYLALVHLKNKKNTEGVVLLKQIAAQTDGRFQQQATALLKALHEN